MSAILLIDDHAIFGKITSVYLSRTRYGGWTFNHATSVKDAINLLKEHTYSVVILDNRIPPDYNFRASLHSFKETDLDTPIILLSGENVADLGDEDIDHMISKYMLKDDFTPDTLEKAISETLKDAAL